MNPEDLADAEQERHMTEKISRAQVKELIQAALYYRDMAYAPYSEFRVGAAVLTESGKIYGGCNVENASYGAGICAERTAAVKAVSEGETKFLALAVCGQRAEAAEEDYVYTYPCGICRQFLREFTAEDAAVFIVKTKEDWRETTFGALFPHSFGPENL